MATDRENIDMHAESTDTGEQTDRTDSQQISRPEDPKPKSTSACSADESKARPQTSWGTQGPSRPYAGSVAVEKDYKATHPIGSRKVTGNVITYHEPIFQSLANTLFENQKNLTMGKRKFEEDHVKTESVSPDSKRKKVENIRESISDPNVKIKKKCTIENIIERIRTEKTMSRGSGSGSQSCPAGSVADGDANENGRQSEIKQQESTAIQTRNVNQKESVENQLVKTSGCKMSCETPGEMMEKSVKTEQVSDTCKREKMESPKKTVSFKTFESANLPKVEIKQESKESSSPLKFTKLIETSKEKVTDSKPEVEVKKSVGSASPDKNVKVTLSKDDVSKACKYKKMKEISEISDAQMKVKKPRKSKDNESKTKLADKKVKVKKKKSDSENENKNGSPKTKTTEKNSKNKQPKEPEMTQDKKADNKKSKKSSEDNGKSKGKEKNEDSDKKQKQKSKKQKPDEDKTKKQKAPDFQGRVKRLASLNASTFMNILYEKTPKTPKMNAKRSKSESDLANTPQKALSSSLSLTSVTNKSEIHAESKSESSNTQEDTSSTGIQLDLKSALKSPKKEKFSPNGNIDSKKGTSNESKNISPKRKISFSDEIRIDEESFNEVFNDTGKTGKGASTKLGRGVKKALGKLEKSTSDKGNGRKRGPKPQGNNNKRSKVLPAKSPEEVAERKKKANLARLKKAKELLRAKRQKVREEINLDIEIESSSDKEEKQSSSDDSLTSISEKSDENKVFKIRAKRGELFRAARTHVSVEAKTVFENTASSPKWCECCQTSYFPSQPHQGMKVWLLKQLVDKGSSRAPEPIQSSSHHFITAHASCEVRPYSSPTHVPMLESSPYVSPLVSHGHVTCSGCGCGHSGMLHTAQCQNYSLGAVGNILSCQHYSGTYTVPYPHSSYTRCGCASCCPGNSYHHAAGQPILHQPQIPISTDASILLHRPVQLQMTHDPPHSVPIQLSHSDSSLSSHSLPLHLSHTDSGMPDLAQSCHCLPGEVTNVTLVGSNTPSDVEYIDVGKEDIAAKTPSCTPVFKKSGIKDRNSSKLVAKMIKLKNVNKNSEQLKQRFRHTRDQLNKKIKDKMINNREKSHVQTKVRRQKKVEEVEKKLKLLEIKKNKVSASDPQLEKGTKKVLDKKAVGKKAKKETVKKVEVQDVEANRLDKEELKEEPRAWHGWSWEGEGCVKKIINIFDGKEVQRKCFNAIRHDDGEIIQVKDCIMVCSGRKMRDIPYVAKVTNFWEDAVSGEMMMTILWYYRPEHIEGGRKPEHEQNELFAAKHRDESLVACIEDRGYVLTFNEYCRYMGEVRRTNYSFPTRKKVVPDLEEAPQSSRMPPIDVDPDNVFLCRHVYDLKLKRVLKNPS